MFYPKKDGSFQLIQGLKCQLPPKGWLFDVLARGGKGEMVRQKNPGNGNAGTEKDGIYKRSTNPSACYWEVDYRFRPEKRGEPALYEKWEAEEKERRKTNADFIHAQLAEFKAYCWRHRLAGMWFSNNGKATYITGLHWYYLSVFRLETNQLPDYRETDREIFYFWEYAVEDPECMGIIEVTKRRNGKSFRVGAMALEGATGNKDFPVGMQSKSDDDVKELYTKCVIGPYRSLPSFFKPLSNVPDNGKIPMKGIFFNSGKLQKDVSELGSKIDFQPSGEFQYDSQKLRRYIGDEEGKTIHADVQKRWGVVRHCLVDHNKRIIGKSWHTTTVEEMAKGGKAFFEMWKRSDQHKMFDEGRPHTPSRLFRFFLPADRGRDVDRYGYVNVEAVRKAIMEEREMEEDADELSGMKRREPLNEREAFQQSSASGSYSSKDLMIEQLDLLSWPGPKLGKPEYRTGNFEWENGERFSRVKFVECRDGRFKMSYDPPPEFRNRVVSNGTAHKPEGLAIFFAGADPIDQRWTEKSSQPKLSKPALSIRKRPSSLLTAPEVDHGPVLIYLFRPPVPSIYYEDSLKACWYYGCKLLYEANKPNMGYYFVDEGCEEFLARLHGKNKYGIDTSESTTNDMTSLKEEYWANYAYTCAFPQLIEQDLMFNPAETRKFDLSMADGFAEILMKGHLGKFYQQEPSQKKTALEDLLPSGLF